MTGLFDTSWLQGRVAACRACSVEVIQDRRSVDLEPRGEGVDRHTGLVRRDQLGHTDCGQPALTSP